MTEVLARLQKVPRVWLYAIALVLLALPLVIEPRLPAEAAAPTTRALFDLIDSCPPDKVVLIDSSWDQGSAAENRAQFAALVQHVVKKRIRFVVTSIGVTALAPVFAQGIVEPLANEAGLVYGTDYVLCGFVPGPPGGLAAILQPLSTEFHSIYPKDMHNTPMEELPLMRHVRSAKQIHAAVVVTYAPTNEWFTVLRQQAGVPVGFAAMSIMSPTYYPFYEAGQLAGLLVGNAGAGQYEVLTGKADRGVKLALAGSFANVLIIVAALVGNIGWWADRRMKRRVRP